MQTPAERLNEVLQAVNLNIKALSEALDTSARKACTTWRRAEQKVFQMIWQIGL